MYACIHRYQMSGSPMHGAAGRRGAILTRTPGFVASIAVEGARGVLFAITLFDDRASLIEALALTNRLSAEPCATEVAIGEVVAQKGL
jgi:hypothetical protein